MKRALGQRYKLVSLLDMLRIYAQPYIQIGLEAGAIMKWIDAAVANEPWRNAVPVDDSLKDHLEQVLKIIEAECGKAALYCTVTSSIEWFREQYKESRPTHADVRSFVGHLVYIFTAELNKQMLFQVCEGEVPFYQTVLEPEIISAFPTAAREIEDAGRCFALDQWTACVMHLMRGLEFGITSLVTALAFTPSSPNWHIVLNECEREIRKIAADKKTPTWKEDETFYDEVATTFRHFKGAWRNHAMHGHETYDQREAVNIFMNVREFFRHISIRLSE